MSKETKINLSPTDSLPTLESNQKKSRTWKIWKEISLNLLVVGLLGLIVVAFVQFNPPQDRLNLARKEIQAIVGEYYIGQIPEDQKFTEGQLKGYVSALNDPYSIYMTSGDNSEFEDNVNERYDGVGVRFEKKDDLIQVIDTVAGGPAERAGIKSKDVLLQIDKQSVTQLDLNSIAKLILGKAGTGVNFLIRRGEEEISFDLVREKINAPLVRLDIRGNIGVIRVSSFGNSLDQEMLSIANQIVDTPTINKLILDLRSNGGGVLTSAVDLTSYFLDKDLLVAKEQAKKETLEDKTVQKEISLKDYPLVVLTDGNTASASEIVAAALRDQRQIPLIGQTTYGKGVVQQIFQLADGSYLKLTIAEWVTPSGLKINKQGLKPDIQIETAEDSLETVLTKYNWETKKLNQINS